MANKNRLEGIHKIYRRDTFHKLWFGFVHGARKADPNKSLFNIHLDFCEVFYEEFEFDAASTMFYRMQHEYMNEPFQ